MTKTLDISPRLALTILAALAIYCSDSLAVVWFDFNPPPLAPRLDPEANASGFTVGAGPAGPSGRF